jgi:hypothetical protein
MDSLQQISDKKFVNENQQNIFLKKKHIYTLMRKIQYKLDTTQVYIMAIPLDQVVLLAQARL